MADSGSPIRISRVELGADLDRLVAEINRCSWDEDNELPEFDTRSLRGYLARQDTVFVTCHEISEGGRQLLGMASGRIEMKPYGGLHWLYIDEVDVPVNQRRRGVGKMLMEYLLELGASCGCTEVWLGTEPDNEAALALYRSLSPIDEEPVVGFAWQLVPTA